MKTSRIVFFPVLRVGPVMGVVLATIVVLASTYIAAIIYTSAVPVGNNLELWYINSEEGWNLVLPQRFEDGCVCEQSFGQKISAIAEIKGEFIVEETSGQMLKVSSDGKEWKSQPIESSQLDLNSFSFHKPENLRFVCIMKNYWWIFALEIVIGSLVIWAIIPKNKSTQN